MSTTAFLRGGSAIAGIAAALFGAYLVYDALGWFVDKRELVIGAAFLAAGATTVGLLRFRRLLLAVAGLALLAVVVGGWRASSFRRPGVAVLLQGELVFSATSLPTSTDGMDAITIAPLRRPHWYETGVTVRFFGRPDGVPSVSDGGDRLVRLGVAKPVATGSTGDTMYEAVIARKLFSRWTH